MNRLPHLLWCLLALIGATGSLSAKGLTDPALRERQRVLVESAVAGLAPQRPGRRARPTRLTRNDVTLNTVFGSSVARSAMARWPRRSVGALPHPVAAAAWIVAMSAHARDRR